MFIVNEHVIIWWLTLTNLDRFAFVQSMFLNLEWAARRWVLILYIQWCVQRSIRHRLARDSRRIYMYIDLFPSSPQPARSSALLQSVIISFRLLWKIFSRPAGVWSSRKPKRRDSDDGGEPRSARCDAGHGRDLSLSRSQHGRQNYQCSSSTLRQM